MLSHTRERGSWGAGRPPPQLPSCRPAVSGVCGAGWGGRDTWQQGRLTLPPPPRPPDTHARRGSVAPCGKVTRPTPGCDRPWTPAPEPWCAPLQKSLHRPQWLLPDTPLVGGSRPTQRALTAVRVRSVGLASGMSCWARRCLNSSLPPREQIDTLVVPTLQVSRVGFGEAAPLVGVLEPGVAALGREPPPERGALPNAERRPARGFCLPVTALPSGEARTAPAAAALTGSAATFLLRHTVPHVAWLPESLVAGLPARLAGFSLKRSFGRLLRREAVPDIQTIPRKRSVRDVSL